MVAVLLRWQVEVTFEELRAHLGMETQRQWGEMMTTRQRSAKPVGKTGGGPERLPAQLSQVNLNAAGIDVGATSHFVAVPQDRAEPPVHEFAAFTADLYRLADWLAESEVETVVMESTGVYWIPLFGVLEERGFEVMLVDPRRIKNVGTSHRSNAHLPPPRSLACSAW